jgi:hypothetical protein
MAVTRESSGFPGFGRLTAAERRILAGTTTGPEPPAAADAAFDAYPWRRHRVRATVLARWLREAPPGDVRINGALVDGELDLSGVRLDRGFELTRCWFTDPLTLDNVTARSVELSGSLIPGVSAKGLTCDLLAVDEHAVVRGQLDISAGSFGRVTLAGVRIENPGEVALDGNVVTTRRSFEINKYAHVVGNARFIGAEIGGQFNASRLHVEGQFSLHEATIARALYLSRSLFEGRVNLSNARVTGWVTAMGTHFVVEKGDAILLDNIEVGRTFQLTKALVRGVVRMSGARVHGVMRLTRMSVEGGTREPRDPADIAAAVRWSGDMLADSAGRVAERRERLAAEQDGPDAPAFESDPLTGVVAMVMDRCSFDLDLEMIAATVHGQVSITGTSVGKRLDARLTRFRSEDGPALLLADCDIGVALRWRDVTIAEGDVVVENVRTRSLDDDPASWTAGRYDVRGLSYESLHVDHAGWSVERRIGWLNGQRGEHSSRPYEALSGWLLAAGRRDDAWDVLRASASRRRATGRVAWLKQAARWTSGRLVGYGYQPERAFVVLLGLIVACGVIFGLRTDAFVARDPSATIAKGCVAGRSCFQPFVYSLDVGLPIVDLGATDVWTVDERRAPAVRWSVLAETALGWLLTTAAVAGITRRVVKS